MKIAGIGHLGPGSILGCPRDMAWWGLLWDENGKKRTENANKTSVKNGNNTIRKRNKNAPVKNKKKTQKTCFYIY